MILEQLRENREISLVNGPSHENELKDLLWDISGGRRVHDFGLFVTAIRQRMYWWYPVASELQEECSCL
jgi:hypothetical protein